MPNYNQTSCEGYSKKGINLDKKEDSSIMSDSAFHQPKGNNSNTNSTTLIPQEFGMFSHPFSFKGRIRRLEFGISLIIFTIWAIIVNIAAEDPDKDINLYINSPGGSVTAGFAIFDTMNYIKCDVSTICVGMAASMVALVHIYSFC